MLKASQTGLLILALYSILGCTFNQQIQEEEFRSLGRFVVREAAEGLEGVVIGAPHGWTDPGSDRLARAISDRTGAGLVIAYGFKSKRLGVTQPLVRPRPRVSSSEDPSKRGSIFRKYKRTLFQAARGSMKLYIGIHRSGEDATAPRVEVSTSGLSFEEAEALKNLYIDIRNRLTQSNEAPKLEIGMEPLDRIFQRISGIKHHGVLMVAEKGLNLWIPQFSSSSSNEVYTKILSLWIEKVIKLLRENPNGLMQVQVKLMDLGRFEFVQSRDGWRGVVIGSPHGSFDEHTAEVVKHLSFQTGIAAVIAKGFTPVEAGGWRINVNRPTEKTFPSTGFELGTDRAKEVYHAFKDLVFKASEVGLNLYVDIHQYGVGNKIQVASVGIAPDQARTVKRLYRAIRDFHLRYQPQLPIVDLLIEPVDPVEIGAWAAKADGILSLARRSLHFELPGNKVLSSTEAREAYTRILANLLTAVAPFLLGIGESPGSQ